MNFFAAGSAQPESPVSDPSTQQQQQTSDIESGSQEVMPTESNDQAYDEIR